ncbi:ankyrin repeat domain-containing protein [Noviherbaspirillum galbum]|uniref:Uncharacterized protein n=1 Tax=Noviherbaspirillum galbum TaxID=2709383 RepID=A0A6B3SQC0_9BURK|nr:ankyrin repeat domain-containing protein [Noviherbaspirillum galbum]NEX62841.1 hypothetical protein [Noviherbaspirillum galbum]
MPDPSGHDQFPGAILEQTLRRLGASDKDELDRHGAPLLARVSAAGDVDAARCLLAAGASVIAGHGYNAPLLRAVLDGHPEIANLLLAHGADVLGPQLCNMTALDLCVRSQDPEFDADARYEMLQHLLGAIDAIVAPGRHWHATGGKPVRSRLEGELPLHVASVRNDPLLLRSLLDKGIKIDAVDAQGNTALHRAAELGNFSCARLLLNAGLPALQPNGEGMTPRRLANAVGPWVSQVMLDCIFRTLPPMPRCSSHSSFSPFSPLPPGLLSLDELHGALPDSAANPRNELDEQTERKDDGEAPFGTPGAGRMSGSEEQGVFTLDLAPDMDAALEDAIARHDAGAVALLLDGGADANGAGGMSIASPLASAVASGDLAIARLLLAHGANPNRVDEFGCHALFNAVLAGHPDRGTLDLLREAGTDLHQTTMEGMTVLEHVLRQARASEADLVLASLLLAWLDDDSKGIRILPRTRSEPRPGADAELVEAVRKAAANDKAELVRALLRAGANPDTLAEGGEPLLHVAAWNRAPRVAQALIEAGANLAARDADGETALHIAARVGAVDVLRKLLACGIDPHARNARGRTARKEYELLAGSRISPPDPRFIDLLFRLPARRN